MTAPASIKERPILFSSEMVRAILDGRKTQTRRVIKLHLDPMPLGAWATLICPHGQVGDRLWVKETWWHHKECRPPFQHSACVRYETFEGYEKCSAMLMPRWASRITLEITSVWIERIQDMSFDDWVADFCPTGLEKERALQTFVGTRNQVEMMKSFWDSLNAKRGYGWDINPFVWAIGFKRIKP